MQTSTWVTGACTVAGLMRVSGTLCGLSAGHPRPGREPGVVRLRSARAGTAQRRRARARRGGHGRGVPRPHRRRAGGPRPSSSCSSTTARATARPAIARTRWPPTDERVKRRHACRATSATRRRSPPGSSTRAATSVVMIDADLQDPPELIPDMLDALAAGRRRRLRGARVARGRDALQAHHRALVLPRSSRASPGSSSRRTRATSA